VGRLPRILLPYGIQLEQRFGRLGREYKQIVFDKKLLAKNPTLEWVTPGHPLFESVRSMVHDKVQEDLQRGTVFYDLNREDPVRLMVFSAEIRDGRGNILHKRLFVAQTTLDGSITIRQPTIFLDLSIAPKGIAAPEDSGMPGREQVETTLYKEALVPMLENEQKQREKDVKTIRRVADTERIRFP